MTLRRLAPLVSLIVLSVSLLLLGGCTSEPAAGQDAAIADASDAVDLSDAGDGDEADDASDADDANDADGDDGDDAGDANPNAPQITIATFNVGVLFDTVCDSGDCGPNDFEKALTPAELEARVDELATAIRGLDAEVVLLQEIENQDAFDALQQAFDGDYPVGVFGEIGSHSSGWISIDVGVLAKGELVDTRDYREVGALQRPDGTATEFAREFLRVDLEIDGEEVIVFTAHFKAMTANDDVGRRIAEAEGARTIVEQVALDNPEALVVLGGDLNTLPGMEPMEALTADDGLVRVAAEKSLEETYTYIWQDELEAIDHLLWEPTSGGDYIEGSVHSLHDREPFGYGGSDHGALVADFELR